MTLGGNETTYHRAQTLEENGKKHSDEMEDDIGEYKSAFLTERGESLKSDQRASFLVSHRSLQTWKSSRERRYHGGTQLSDWKDPVSGIGVLDEHFGLIDEKWDNYHKYRKRQEEIQKQAEQFDSMKDRQSAVYDQFQNRLSALRDEAPSTTSQDTSSAAAAVSMGEGLTAAEETDQPEGDTLKPGGEELVLEGQGPLAIGAVAGSAAGTATAVNNFATLRHKTPVSLPIQEVFNEIVYGPWAAQWGRDFIERSATAQIGNQFGFVGAGYGLEERELEFKTGWRDIVASATYDEFAQLVDVGVIKGAYGVDIDRSNLERATAVEVTARGTQLATLADFNDRLIGQRVKVRDFEINLRHDFDDIVVAGDIGIATEIFLSFRTVSLSIGSDVRDTSYAVAFSARGYSVAVLRNFVNRSSDIQANWGNGWQLVMQADFIDPFNSEVFTRVGFGKVGRFYAEVGAGVGDDGIPQGSASIETADVAIASEFLDNLGDRLLVQSVSVGKFTYVWESTVVPSNIILPVILGVDPLLVGTALSP